MTTITRIFSTFNSSGGSYYGKANEPKEQANIDSIWGNHSFKSNFSEDNFTGNNNGFEGVKYPQPAAFSDSMPAPFGANVDLLKTEGQNNNPFASFNQNNAMLLSNLMHGVNSNINRNFLSLTGNHHEHKHGNHINPQFGSQTAGLHIISPNRMLGSIR